MTEEPEGPSTEPDEDEGRLSMFDPPAWRRRTVEVRLEIAGPSQLEAVVVCR